MLFIKNVFVKMIFDDFFVSMVKIAMSSFFGLKNQHK